MSQTSNRANEEREPHATAIRASRLGGRRRSRFSPIWMVHNVSVARDPRLTLIFFIVLGLIGLGEATPYDLKARVAASIGNFWSVPHSALYAEPDRLAAEGLLKVEQEPHGLRRKRYTITASGREVLDEWRARPAPSLPEIRDESLLKLFFGADPRAIAGAQRDAHRQKLAAYEERAAQDDGSEPRGPWRTLAAGIAHEREWVRYWSELAEAEPDRAAPGGEALPPEAGQGNGERAGVLGGRSR